MVLHQCIQNFNFQLYLAENHIFSLEDSPILVTIKSLQLSTTHLQFNHNYANRMQRHQQNEEQVKLVTEDTTSHIRYVYTNQSYYEGNKDNF